MPGEVEDTSLILSRGAFFEGKLGFEGRALLYGRFKGEVESPGALVIAPGAKVEALVSAEEVLIKGYFKGEIKARRQITLFSGSECYGVLSAPHLHIKPGALFEGRCKKV